MSHQRTEGTPGWYAQLLRAQERALRVTLAPRLRARDAGVTLGGRSNRVRHPTLGHVAAERLVPGEDPPPRELEQHVARYAWAFRHCAHRRVVDVGCGAGYGTFLLHWVAADALGVDRDEQAIAAARASFSGPRYELVGETPEALPHADVAVCFEVLEHVDAPGALLRDLLAAAPVVLLSYPNPFAAGPHLNPHHRVDWPLRVLKEQLRRAGAREIAWHHQRLGSPTVRSGAPPWAAVWIAHATR